ncbi:PadR family transcriptional regulator [Romboutsia lituseburensis]|uniref:Transcriptional regulator PadR-like family protein n=1 Tax=Romboutsia lituseburensis DSM 797 TaxID=1121325 RepID=A0A1G9J052_9FIRM|nr:PadR family transcriptional regulator [Romboutsia lituseburensis]CEH33685.1 Transcriptional regulator PadR-like family [Romboutsia lituseburensis]SDL30888.1 Transcriptional regulator PadR-like family protein [Romboutsia lituseburensis DSM 797]
MKEDIVKKYLPMTEATYYILLCMVKPIHGYKLMQDVETLTNGTVTLGPGTLYGATSKLVKDGLIKQVESKEERRKSYQLTELGNEILLLEYNRLNLSVENGKKILEGLEV